MRIYVRKKEYDESNCLLVDIWEQSLQRVIDMQPTDSVRSLRSKIQGVFSIGDEEMGRRMVVHDGRELPDDENDEDGSSPTLEQCGIKDWASLDVGFKGPFFANVFTSDGRKLYLELSPFDTFRELRERVQDENCTWKGDGRTLISNGIFRKTTNAEAPQFNISLTPRRKFYIMVEFPSESSCGLFSLACKPTDTIHALRKAIAKKSYDANDELLFGLTPIREGQFVLLFYGKHLKDGSSTLRECGIKRGATISLAGKATLRISITVAKTGLHYRLPMKCFHTVGKLKRMLFSRTHIPPWQQRLTYEKCSLVNEKELLVDHGIEEQFVYDDFCKKHRKRRRSHSQKSCKEEFVIQLDNVEPSNDSSTAGRSSQTTVDGPHVRCSIPDRRCQPMGFDDLDALLQVAVEIPSISLRIPCMFQPTDTICDVRQEIQTNITKGLFVLFSHREKLGDEFTTLEACGIKNMDSIQVLEEESFEIAISAPEQGVDIHVRVDCFDTVGLLKEKLQDVTGIPRERQRLVYHKWFLDDDERLLVDHGIVTASLTHILNPDVHPHRNPSKEEFHIFVFASSGDPESGRCSSATKAGLSSEEFRKSVVICGSPPPHATFPDDDCSPATPLMQIAIEIPNMPWRFPLVCNPTDTVGKVRQAIQQGCYNGYKELFGQRYIEWGLFVLSFDRKLLLDESITLGESGIKHMDSVQLLEDASFPIDISVDERRLYTRVHMKCFDTIRKLKEDIFYMAGIPPEQQHLYLGGFRWWLEDDDEGRRLVDYGIAREVQYDQESLLLVQRGNTPGKRPPCRKGKIFNVSAASSRRLADRGRVGLT